MVEVKKSKEETPSYWGATEKTCPVCIEKIPIAALVCPFCNSPFRDARPTTREELMPAPEDPALADFRKKAVVLFILSLLGCMSPFVLILGSKWYRSNRDQIAQAGPTARALSLIGLGICVLYLVVVGLSLLVWQITA
ncbi:MAG: hypothetical protein ACREA9_06630, partial [Pyrinomonadaceae bacterium]